MGKRASPGLFCGAILCPVAAFILLSMMSIGYNRHRQPLGHQRQMALHSVSAALVWPVLCWTGLPVLNAATQGQCVADDDTEAKRLAKEVRVLIWVMTSPQNLQSRARMVRDTWGRRANQLIFFSSETNENFPTVGLDVKEGRQHLTAKTMKAFRYLYEKHLEDADWFMKVDDDTYVIVENLHYFLYDKNPNEAVFYGHHLHDDYVKQGFHSGGAGYVISKEALRRYGEKGNDARLCPPDGEVEDVEFGMCMERLGVKTADSTDALGRSRFHCFDPSTHLNGQYPAWYYQNDVHGARKGVDSISDYPVTFHYVKPTEMQALEFYVYHLAPYGIVRGH